MKKWIVLFLFAGTALLSTAQDTLWRKGGVLGANLSQASYSDWAAGGQNSFSVTGLFNVFANYHTKDSVVMWENTLETAYGKIQVFGKKDLQKIDDKIDFSSIYNHRAFSKSWYYTTLFNFKSQFDKGYNYPNDSVIASGFMSPGYFLYAGGLKYEPEKEFSILIAPLTGKTTVVSDQGLADSGAYGVVKATYDTAGKLTTHGKKIRNQFGGLIQVRIKKEIVKNVLIDTKAEVFSDYLKNPGNLDVYWDLKFEMKVNNFLSVSVNTTLIYDDDIIIKRDSNGDGVFEVNGPRTQFKEVLGVGLAYKFGNKK